MANTKSAAQFVKITKRNRQRNLAQSAQVKDLFKTLRKAESMTPEEGNQILSKIYQTLDKVSRHVVHPNKANRLKSRAAQAVAELIKK